MWWKLYALYPYDVRCLSHFCCVPNRVRVKKWSKLTFFTLKTWKIYNVCHIFVECRIEYEINNARIKVYYFHSKNLKNLQCMLHFCYVPNRVRGCVRLGNLDLDFKIRISDLQSNAKSENGFQRWDIWFWIFIFTVRLWKSAKGFEKLFLRTAVLHAHA